MSFSLMIVVIVLGGWFWGRVSNRVKLPAILGMLLWGMLINLQWGSNIPDSLWEIAPFLKSLALIVILLRAGLGINRLMLRKSGITAVLMGFVPCLTEALGLTFAFRYLMGFPLMVAAMAAFILSAVSPAVVIPSMINLKARGHGAKKQIPTMILAGASIDDVVAFTFFTLCMNLALAKHANLWVSILSIPYAILGGIAAGLLMGYVLIQVFRRVKAPIRATEKMLMLITFSLLMLELGNRIHIAALLGAMTTGFILYEKENQIANQLSAKLSKWWIFAEIILFVLIGMSVQPVHIYKAGLRGLAVIAIGLLFRSVGVIIATAFSRLNKKEKLFCIITYLPKATVQAALGTVPLAMGFAEGQAILSVAVMSILVTAPLGLFLIQVFGNKLLKIDL